MSASWYHSVDIFNHSSAGGTTRVRIAGCLGSREGIPSRAIFGGIGAGKTSLLPGDIESHMEKLATEIQE